MQRLLFLLALVGVVLTACNKDDFDAVEQLEKDKVAIRQYLADKNLTADSTASGLYYITTKEGDGTAHPNLGSTVVVGYKGYRLDGFVFDQSQSGAPATFALANLIAGWREGIQLMKKNGRMTMFVPSYLAYGRYGAGADIPANTPLIFEIELVDFY